MKILTLSMNREAARFLSEAIFHLDNAVRVYFKAYGTHPTAKSVKLAKRFINSAIAELECAKPPADFRSPKFDRMNGYPKLPPKPPCVHCYEVVGQTNFRGQCELRVRCGAFDKTRPYVECNEHCCEYAKSEKGDE